MSSIEFENKRFELVARCLNQWKNTKDFGCNRLITLPGAVFPCYRQSFFSNCNNGRKTFAHAAILLSFMQRVEDYLVARKDFDFSVP